MSGCGDNDGHSTFSKVAVHYSVSEGVIVRADSMLEEPE
jgi:hypothetical protein